MCLWRCVWEGYSDCEREPLCLLKVSRGSVAVNQRAEAGLPDGYQCLCKVLCSPALLEREAGAIDLAIDFPHRCLFLMTLELSLLFVIASVLWIQPCLLAKAESSRNWSGSVTFFFSPLSGEINYCLVTGNHFSLLKQITQGSYVSASPLSGIYFRGAVVLGFWSRALDRVFPDCLFSWYLPVILFLSACGGGDEPSTSPLPALLFVLWKTAVALGDRLESRRGALPLTFPWERSLLPTRRLLPSRPLSPDLGVTHRETTCSSEQNAN